MRKGFGILTYDNDSGKDTALGRVPIAAGEYEGYECFRSI